MNTRCLRSTQEEGGSRWSSFIKVAFVVISVIFSRRLCANNISVDIRQAYPIRKRIGYTVTNWRYSQVSQVYMPRETTAENYRKLTKNAVSGRGVFSTLRILCSHALCMLFYFILASHALHRCGLLRQMTRSSLSVGHKGECCKNSWTDRDAVWGLTHVGPRNHALHVVQISKGNGTGNYGSLRPIYKHRKLLLRCTQQTINNGIRAILLQPTALLPISRCRINFPMKRPLVKIFDHSLFVTSVWLHLAFKPYSGSY